MIASPLSALTEELMIGLNVSNEQHTMQQAQIPDSNDYNVQQIPYDPFSNYFSIPYDQGKNMLPFFMKILKF
jgi:hypothetical protein